MRLKLSNVQTISLDHTANLFNWIMVSNISP